MRSKIDRLKSVIVRTVKAIAKITAGTAVLELSKISVNGNNMRKTGDDSGLRELAESIRQTGVLQPVLVRPKGKQYEIVCGERRFRASVLAETGTIPAVIRKLSDGEALEMSLTENLQRRDLSPVEEATAYKRLSNTGRYNAASLAVRFGKSESYIRNRMKLNDLTDDLLNLVDEGALSVPAALELCKYSAEIQSDIYEKHLAGTVDCYSDWRNLNSREFTARLENAYCSDLSRYSFDKSECARCTFNTDSDTLFAENGGRCSNLNCLTEKNGKYLSKACAAAQETPDMKLCCLPNSENGEISNALSGQETAKTDGYADLTEKQKRKLVKYYHNTHIIRHEYVQHKQSGRNGYLCFILDKETVLCEPDVKHIKAVAKKTETAFTVELYRGDFMCVCFFAAGFSK
jgi:ParB family chromosome partitioning protein